MNTPLEILVVSDATGATAEAVVNSTLVQFGRANVRVRRHPFTRTVEQAREILDGADQRAVVVFTFVSSEMSAAMVELGRSRNLTMVDLLSPLMGIFSHALHSIPSRTPGAFRGQTEDMFEVVEAIHFTRRHDDGQGLETMDQADLIILGVSRTGKTPTSIFLSCRKLKVANVPIVLDVPLPDEVRLARAPKVGFRMDLERQVQVRSERAGRMGARIPRYSERGHIMEEITYCDRIYRSLSGIRSVDVTNRSIEETSDWITHNVL
ncbi:MAG: pyruvate, water dikinase regulatory protein [Thermoanaerobaculales bacterium]|jgi:regulator of PEP synthase PpsR (kinase-PPPase family)|nr:pyruvate, water dikinase regulatory protein [Thermoanaerobaculales bacterium]